MPDLRRWIRKPALIKEPTTLNDYLEVVLDVNAELGSRCFKMMEVLAYMDPKMESSMYKLLNQMESQVDAWEEELQEMYPFEQ